MRIRNLATSTTDPNQAGELMLEATKQRVKMTKKILALDFLKGLKRRRLGTPLVEKAAKSLTESSERNEQIYQINNTRKIYFFQPSFEEM